MIGQDWSTLKKLMFAKTAAAGAAVTEATATGNPLTFVTDLARPLKSLLIPFSDENGVTGLKVWHGGKNLLNPAWWGDFADNRSYVRYDNGILVYQAISYKASDYVSVMGNTEYTLHAVMRGQGVSGIAFYDSSKQYISGIQINISTKKDHTFTTPSNAVYMRFWDDSGVMPWNEVMLVYGSTAPTAYEEYKPITEYDVIFPVEAGTPTAGQLDIISGILTVTAPTAGIYQLTGEQIAAFVGGNTIWSDADGSMTATYLKKG